MGQFRHSLHFNVQIQHQWLECLLSFVDLQQERIFSFILVLHTETQVGPIP